MRVAVIGAGMAGLGCARVLASAGCAVTVFEKSRGVGGRVASRRAEATVLDHGTPDLALDTSVGRALLEACGGPDVIPIDRPSGRLRDGTFTPGEDRRSVGYAAGLTQLAKRMSDGLDLRLGVRIAALRPAGAGLEIGDEQGNTHGTADAVVVTAPAPQAADLLERSPENGLRVAQLRGVRYDAAIVVLAGLRIAEPQWWLAELDAGPLASIAIETAKGRVPVEGRVPVVVRLTPQVSAELIDASDEAALAVALPALGAAFGVGADRVGWTHVKRWRFARPTTPAGFADANPPGSRVIVCGDAIAPGGVADAYAGGLTAAARVCADLGVIAPGREHIDDDPAPPAP